MVTKEVFLKNLRDNLLNTYETIESDYISDKAPALSEEIFALGIEYGILVSLENSKPKSSVQTIVQVALKMRRLLPQYLRAVNSSLLKVLLFKE